MIGKGETVRMSGDDDVLQDAAKVAGYSDARAALDDAAAQVGAARPGSRLGLPCAFGWCDPGQRRTDTMLVMAAVALPAGGMHEAGTHAVLLPACPWCCEAIARSKVTRA